MVRPVDLGKSFRRCDSSENKVRREDVWPMETRKSKVKRLVKGWGSTEKDSVMVEQEKRKEKKINTLA